MSYIGNNPVNQNFVAGSDQFNGTGSQTVFTLSRNVNTVNDIQVVVSNVPQDPFTAYSVAGNSLTFTSAPPSGTGNIYVTYRATNVQTFVPSPGATVGGSFGIQGNLNFFGTGNRITGDFSNATFANRVAFQTSTANSATTVLVIPSGTGTTASWDAYNNSDPTNSSYLGLSALSTEARLSSTIRGTGTFLPMTFYTGGSERMRVDTSGNVGIGTSSPAASLSVTKQTTALSGTGNSYGAYLYPTSTGQCFLDALTSSSGNTSMGIRSYNNGTYYSANLDNSGNFQFNSGYGSTATAYGCRAWVNFNGTGTVAIRASGNVSSITDNGNGDYTVNFSTAMADANYSWSAIGSDIAAIRRTFAPYTSAPTSSAFRFLVTDNAINQIDAVYNAVAIFR